MKNPSESTQIDIEKTYSKYQLLPVLRAEFAEFLGEPNEGNIDYFKFCVDVLVHISLHKQADVITMVGILSPKFGEPQEVADLLQKACEDDLLDFSLESERFSLKYSISEDVQKKLDLYQYPLPMVIPPKKINKTTETGYLTIKGSVVLNGSKYFNDKDLCLDHLDRANSVALAVNTAVTKSNEGKFIKPVRKNGEDFEDFTRRQKQAKVFFKSSTEVMKGLALVTDTIYLTHKYDRRGRCYCSGYHISTQGDDYRKAVLQFANKEMINA